MMETIHTSDMSVYFNETTQPYILAGYHFQKYKSLHLWEKGGFDVTCHVSRFIMELVVQYILSDIYR
jgi:hypothetical protein